MNRSQNRNPDLVIEWTPNRVRVLDVGRQSITVGDRLADALPEGFRGLDAIVGVGRRSVFVRGMFLPNASRSELAKILDIQSERLIPFRPGEYVMGFRMGPEVRDRGRLVVIAAIKTESLERIFREASECRIKLRAVLPVAFSSWIANQKGNETDCATVETNADALNIDLLHYGELWYSRVVPSPDSDAQIRDEISRTFTIAQLEPTGVRTHRDALLDLVDLNLIERQLFTFDLPGKVDAEWARRRRWRMQRALAMASVATIVGGYTALAFLPPPPTPGARAKSETLAQAHQKLADAEAKRKEIELGNQILSVATRPAQSLSDVAIVLSHSAPQNLWLTNIVLARGTPMTLSGYALSEHDVIEFVRKLGSDPRFREVRLLNVSRDLIGKQAVAQFVVTGNIAGLLAFDTPPVEPKKSSGGKKP